MEVGNPQFLWTIPILVVVLLASCTAAQERIIYANDVEEYVLTLGDKTPAL